MMISKDALNYEMEIQENTDIDSVRASYAGYIILWVTGSGRSTEDGDGYYRCLLQFNDYTKYIEGSAANATANQAMIAGACECIKRVTKPSRIAIISATALGFENAFKGKGPNAALLQQLYEEMKNRGCSLTEVRFLNGADSIKSYVYSKSGDQKLIQSKQKEQDRKKEYVSSYKQSIYDECIRKVVAILEKNHVSEDIVNQIRDIAENIE